MSEEAPKDRIVLKLVKIPMLDRDGKAMMDDGEPMWKQEDILGLVHLLGRYDNTKHPGAMKQYRALISVKDKVETVMVEKKEELSLSLDEATWLKDYLTKLPDAEASQNKLQQHEIRTLTSILDQLQ